MKIQLTSEEESIVQNVVGLEIMDPSPCKSCFDQSSCLGGCVKYCRWHDLNYETLDNYEQLKNTYGFIDFDEIVNSMVELARAIADQEQAMKRVQIAQKKLNDLANNFESNSLFYFDKVFSVSETENE